MERYPLKEIKRFENELKRKNYIKVPKMGITNYSQMQVVGYLLENINKDISQKELESVLSIRKSTISGIIDTMEKNNVIKRELSQDDGRSKIIKLTNENIKRHKEVVKKIREVEKLLTEDIPDEKMFVFFEVLDMMRKNMERDDLKND